MAMTAAGVGARRRLWTHVTTARGAPLALVSGMFAVLQIALGPARIGLGWDETVYVSQVAPGVPAAYFSAPRARGVPLLVAPVAGFTTSTAAIRIYLLVLGAVGLYLAYRVWLPLLPRAAVVVAAALFAGLWPTLFYGSEAMPNFWIALAGVAVVGAAVTAAREGKRSSLVVVGLGLAGMGLIRPSDAVWFALPIVIAPAVVPTWRRTRLWLVSIIGLVVGIAPWVIEAYVRFGGVMQRLHASSLNEGGLRPHLGFLYQARALYGPLLCRPCTQATRPLIFDVWWVLLPIAVVVAVVSSRRSDRYAPLVLAATCGLSVALPYLFLVGYAAPRFLLPTYALLALPVANWSVRLCQSMWARRRATAIVVAAGVAFFVLAQSVAAALQVPVQQVDRRNYARIAGQLHGLGIRAPCVLGGVDAPPVAYYSGCSSSLAHGSASPHSSASWAAYAHRVNYAVVLQGSQPVPSYARSWRRHVFTHLEKHHWMVLLPP